MGQAGSKAEVKGGRAPQAIVFDSGALIAFERGNARMRALAREILDTGVRLIIPARVLAQVWRQPTKQVALGALSKSAATEVVPVDRPLAEAAGALCGSRKTTDVIDATLVLTARRARCHRY